MRMLRPLTLAFCGFALCLVAVALAGAAYFAPPRPEGTISAITITGTTPVPLLPRHGLVCAEERSDLLVTVCRATVLGEPFTVTAVRATPGGTMLASCTASYGERTAPCRGGFPPFVVADGSALGVDGAAVVAARPAWLPDRWLGDRWLRVFIGLAALLALGVAAASLNVPLSHPIGRLALSVGTGFTTFVVATPLLGLYLDALRYLD